MQDDFGQKLRNTDVTSQVLDFVMKLDDKEISENKNIPVKHFLIDLRFMLLKPKLEKINDWNQRDDDNFNIIDFSQDGYSQFQLSKFLLAINEVYGQEVDSQMEIRYCIDSLFERNLNIIKI